MHGRAELNLPLHASLRHKTVLLGSSTLVSENKMSDAEVRRRIREIYGLSDQDEQSRRVIPQGGTALPNLRMGKAVNRSKNRISERTHREVAKFLLISYPVPATPRIRVLQFKHAQKSAKPGQMCQN